MILIYAHTTSPRLQYIARFIFSELLGTEMRITIDSNEFKNFDGAKINYSSDAIVPGEYRIGNTNLLFENGISLQEIICFSVNGNTAFFKTNGDHPFDIFAASFYLLSRYEEYLPHTKDIYGRYAHENSLAFKENFLNKPIINIWVMELGKALQEKFSTVNIQYSIFNIQLTYDIDIAYSYKHKGFLRNLGSFFRSPSMERIKVLAGSAKDPFDAYDEMDDLHQRYGLQPTYFFLVPEKNSQYDKNILPHKTAMWDLVKRHASKYPVGLHPSWQCEDDPGLIRSEKEQVEAMSGKHINTCRFHYLHFNLPYGYRRLMAEGFTHDHSMAYGSINGFRASVASAFFWYDLEKEEETTLRIHPFCFMEANAFYEEKLSPAETLDEMLYYCNACRQVNGTFIMLWHNHFLGTDPLYKGLPEVYEKFLAQIETVKF